MNALALTWADHRRTQELCAGLDLELVVLRTSLRGPLRYLALTTRTLALLLRRRVDVLLVQNPSLVLAALTAVLRRALGYRLIVDAHNEAVVPFINTQRWVRWLSQWVIRKSDLSIVTNRQLAAMVDGSGGRAFVLPDRVPVPPDSATRRDLAGSFNVALIATYAPDEPIAEVFAAVQGTNVQLYVTGNSRKLNPRVMAAAPANVRFTGFLQEEEYWSLLRSADAVIDLTLMDDCLVCGAYEALALGKPMVLSNNAATVELFGDAAAYTDNTVADIRRALERLRHEHARLAAAAEKKRGELTDRWTVAARDLARRVADGHPGRRPEGD